MQVGVNVKMNKISARIANGYCGKAHVKSNALGVRLDPDLTRTELNPENTLSMYPSGECDVSRIVVSCSKLTAHE